MLLTYLFNYKKKYIEQIFILFISNLYKHLRTLGKVGTKCIVYKVVFSFLKCNRQQMGCFAILPSNAETRFALFSL